VSALARRDADAMNYVRQVVVFDAADVATLPPA